MFRVFCFLILISCGGEDRVIEKQVPVPGQQQPGQPPDPGPKPGQRISYAQMQGLLSEYCVACHSTAGFMQSEAGLRRSGVLGQLNSRNMPPSNGKPLPDGGRTLMVNFF